MGEINSILFPWIGIAVSVAGGGDPVDDVIMPAVNVLPLGILLSNLLLLRLFQTGAGREG